DQTAVRVSHIAVPADRQTAEAEKAKVRQSLAEARAQILAGKITFPDAVKKYSKCPMSDPQGGDLGYIPRKYVVDDAFARTAFTLQANQISEVVETETWMHLILVTERKMGAPSEYDKSRDMVRDCCITDLAQAILAQQRKAAKVEINLP